MRKKETWVEDLNEYLKSIRGKHLQWGVHDCLFMPADAVLAMTGEDFAAEFRGRYDDASTAYALSRKTEGGSYIGHMDILATRHGWELIERPSLVHRGDICVLDKGTAGADDRFGGSLAMATGDWIFAMGLFGLLATNRDSIVKAWRVNDPR